jgi:hypothetical protein
MIDTRDLDLRVMVAWLSAAWATQEIGRHHGFAACEVAGRDLTIEARVDV